MDWNNEKKHSGIDGLTKFRQLAGIKMEWNKDCPTLFGTNLPHFGSKSDTPAEVKAFRIDADGYPPTK